MVKLFEIKLTDCSDRAWWFEAKQKYKVRIDKKTGEGSCDCEGDTFKRSGRKQQECKHIQKAREILKATGRIK